MQPIPLSLPRPVPLQKFRAPKKNIPPTPIQRNHILNFIRQYVAETKPVPPLPVPELKKHAEAIVARLKCDPLYLDYIGVLLNNELWRESLATVPFERRLLLLPKCLRVENKCPAPFDEFGLLCKQCGLCSIQDLQLEAERLGYAVLVAEGSAIVMSLIQTGKIEAIVGVSCLSVLERAFPYMEAAAIPGVAVPLLQDDCIDTNVDIDWVWDYIHLTSEDKTRRLDLTALRDEVDSWFSEASLDALLGPAQGSAEQIGRKWLAKAGKRWRPFLTVATFQALRENPGDPVPQDLKKIAVAVECFHKASLIHDDIEDEDPQRYGSATLPAEHGTAIALNVGDLLIGEGYRLIASSTTSAEKKTAMLLAGSEGQRQLCRGQGAELAWTAHPEVLSSLQVLQIFSEKTAPAFEVALKLGAIYAGHGDELAEVMENYSRALGIAYQIRDDLNDLGSEGETNDLESMRPTILLAAALERANDETERALLQSVWKRQLPEGKTFAEIEALFRKLGADERARTLYETYKEEAIRSLRDLEHQSLKGLLRRVIGKIFNDTEIKGWCKEFEAQNLGAHAAPVAVTSAPAAVNSAVKEATVAAAV
jgi:geranylgeranyl pyrophosphate synthase